MTRPSFIGNYTDFMDDDNAHYEGSTELLSIGAAVGKKLGLKKTGIHIQTLLPGRRTSWPHAESLEEEFAFVIDGTPDVWINGDLHPLGPGDFVAFPAGTGILHTFINNSAEPVKMLIGGDQRIAENKIIYSPHHPVRNQTMKDKNCFWDNAPVQKLGLHSGEANIPNLVKFNLPRFETNRLILRTLELSDAPWLFKYASLELVTEFISWQTHKSLKETENVIRQLQQNYLKGIPEPYGIFLKSAPDQMIGSVGLFWNSKPHKVMEIGAVIAPEFWGQGITLEAFEALIDFGWKNFDVERIQGRCIQGHTKSRRLMEKMGMTFEGIIRRAINGPKGPKDMEMFSLLRNEWPVSHHL